MAAALRAPCAVVAGRLPGLGAICTTPTLAGNYFCQLRFLADN
jgi:hypothetical protein